MKLCWILFVCVVVALVGVEAGGQERGRGGKAEPSAPAGKPIASVDAPPWPDSLTKNDRAIYIREVRQLLVSGWKGHGAEAIKQSEGHFHAAEAASGQDLRLLYAKGLVSYKQQKYVQAVQEFSRAANVGSYCYLPALEAAIWVNLTRLTKHEPVLELASKLAEALAAEASWPGEAAADDGAEWLGRVMGYLEGPGSSKGLSDEAARLEAEFRPRFPTGRQQRYDDGKANLLGLYAILAPNTVGGQPNDAEIRRRQQLDEKLEKAVEDKGNLESDAAAAKQRYQARLDEIKKQLGTVEQNYRILCSELNRLNGIIVNVRVSLDQVRSQTGSAQGKETQDLGRQQLERELTAELNMVEGQAAIVMSRGRELEAQHQNLAAQYDQTAAEYQQLTGEVLERSTKLNSKIRSLDKKVKQAKAKTGKDVASQAKEKASHELGKYVRWSLEAEKSRVLDSLSER
jgi:hypothetical protein